MHRTNLFKSGCYKQLERKWAKIKTCPRLADLSKLFSMVKLIRYTVQKPLMMVICGHLGGWVYIPLPLPLPLLSLPRKQYYVSERAPNTQYLGSRQEALRTKCLTVKPKNRWPNPKNNKWVSKANEKRGFCQRFQYGSRVFHESEGDREEFSACHSRRLHYKLPEISRNV